MTVKLQVVGDPVAHSLSPQIHALFAKQFDDEVVYGRERVRSGEFEVCADAFRAAGGLGMNITVPHKEAAFTYVDAPDAYACAAGAVNTIKFLDNGESLGSNTDGQGLVADLTERWALGLVGQTVLILGAGGATRGVIVPLFEAGVSRILIANRTATRAEHLCQALRASLPPAAHLSAHGLDVSLDDESIDVIINATSVGLEGVGLNLPVGDAQVRQAFCYDMGYGSNAGFHRQVRAVADTSVDGLGMLVEQAALSYKLWLGHQPETQPVYQAVRSMLLEDS